MAARVALSLLLFAAASAVQDDVYSAAESSYERLLASGDIALALGNPSFGSVDAESYTYYLVEVPTDFTELYLVLTPQFGNVNLLASTTYAGRPYMGKYQYASKFTVGSEFIRIYPSDPAVLTACPHTGRVGTTCKFSIGVYGATTASYVITASTGGIVKGLTSGLPLEDISSPNTYVTYAYRAESPDTTFTLTTYSGIPAVYLAHPNAASPRPRGDVLESYCKKSAPLYPDGDSTSVSYGILTIPQNDPCACESYPCTYTIGIGSNDHTSYSIAVSDSTSDTTMVKLMDGIPLRAQAPATGEGSLYFEYSFIPQVVQAEASNALITVTLTQHEGSTKAILYASWDSNDDSTAFPSQENYDYAASIAAGTATFTASSMDQSFVSTCGADMAYVCTIRFAVVGASDGLYTIVTATDSGIQLSDGLPMVGEVTAGTDEIAYFRYRHALPLAPLVFAVTPVTGTVDMFVSCVSATDITGYLPTEAHHQWKVVSSIPSIQRSLVSLSIRPDAPGACVAPATYYIGVRAGTGSDGRTSFSVLARTRGETTVGLLDGQPVNDLIVGGSDSLPSPDGSDGEYSMYSYSLAPTDQSVSLTINAVKGNVAMYVTVDGSLPSNKAYQYVLPLSSSKDLRKDRSILLTRSDPLIRDACSNIVTRNVTTSHQEYTCVLPVNATEEVCGYRTVYTHELVTEDLGPHACTVNIAVNSDLNGAAYSITASSFYKYLQDGVTAEVDIPADGTVYMLYESSYGAAHSQLVLTPVFGRAIAYVSTDEHVPNAVNAQHTFGGVHASVLSLDNSMTVCAQEGISRCLHYVAIKPYSDGPVRVRVTGNSMSTIAVDISTPVVGHSYPDRLTYYSFTLPTTLSQTQLTEGIAIDIEAFSSSGWILALLSHTVDPVTNAVVPPTLFCSNPKYTLLTCPASDKVSANVDVTVQGLPSRTRISIPAGSAALRPGASFVLGVVSHTATDFVVSVKPAGESIALANGITTYDQFDSQTATPIQYKIVLPQQAVRGSLEPVVIQATPIEGYMTLYLGVNKPNPEPGTRGVTYDDVAGFAESYRFMVHPQYLENKCPSTDDCVLYVSVHPAEYTSYPVQYSIVTSTGAAASDTPTLLIPGVAQLASAVADAYTYFYVPLRNNGESFHVALQEINGDAAMYINTDGTLPTASSHAIRVDRALVPELVVIRPDHPAYIYDGILTIGVKSLPTITQFYITVGTADTVVDLPDGAPLLGSAEPGKYTYYSLNTPGTVEGGVSFAVVPLSGQVELYGSVWYHGASTNQFEKSAFRPNRETDHHMFAGNTEGALAISADHPNACTEECTYIFAVYCSSNGTAPCHFEVSGAASDQSLERLVEGVPSTSELQQGQTKYYVLNGGHDHAEFKFSAQEIAGSIVMMLSEVFVPGYSAFSDLPSLDIPSTYTRITKEGDSILRYSQYGDTFFDPSFSAVVRDRIYVLAVHAPATPASFSLVVSRKGAASVLMPGFPSTNNWIGSRQTHYYMFDHQDTTSDLLVTLTALYGDVTVSVSPRGETVPMCTFSVPQSNVRTTVTCSNVVWQVSNTPGNPGSHVLRIRGENPCGNAISSTDCNSTMDWRNGNFWIAVSSFSASLYSITAASSLDPIRLLDGIPSHYVSTYALDEHSDTYSATPVLVYQVRYDAPAPDIRVTIAADNMHAAYTYYLTSCPYHSCTAEGKNPGPEHYTLTGHGNAGARLNLVLDTASPAYCIGDAMYGNLCNYHLTLVPDVENCAEKNVDSCMVHADVVFVSTSADAPINIDSTAIDGRSVTVAGTVDVGADGTVSRMPIYHLYLNRENYAGATYSDFSVRLDSCDTLRGQPLAYLCASTPSSGVSGCASPRRPGPDEGDHMYMLSASSTNGDGLVLSQESSNEIYLAVDSVPLSVNHTLASDKAMKLYGPITYELHITDSSSMRIVLPDNLEEMIAVTRVSDTVANVTWSPVMVAVHGGMDAPVLTAVGVKYMVYYAVESFSGYASNVLKVNESDIGIVSTTPCGLERWAHIVSNATNAFTPIEIATESQPTTVIEKLSRNKRYRLTVVAYCDIDCLNANYAQLELPIPNGSFSTQRIAYTAIDFSLMPEDENQGGGDPISTSFYSFGIICMIALVVASVYLGFRKPPASVSTDAAASAPKPKPAPKQESQVQKSAPPLFGPDGRPIQVNPKSHFFRTRTLPSPDGISASTGLPVDSMSAVGDVAVAVDVPEEASAVTEVEKFHHISNKLLKSRESGTIDTETIDIGPEHDIFNKGSNNVRY